MVMTDEQNSKLIWYLKSLNPSFDDITEEERNVLAEELYDEIFALGLREFIDRIDFMSDKAIVIADANRRDD